MGFCVFVSSFHLQNFKNKHLSNLINWIYLPDLWRIKIMSPAYSGIIPSSIFWGQLLTFVFGWWEEVKIRALWTRLWSTPASCSESPQLGERGFALLEVHWFIEIPNIKLQISNNFQCPKFENPNNVSSWKVLVIEYWNLRFTCNLVLGVCDFSHKTPRQSHLSLTWPWGRGFLKSNKSFFGL